MIESPPKIGNYTETVLSLLANPEYKELLVKAERDYIYWDKAKYIAPKEAKPEDFWAAIKITRHSKFIKFGKYTFSYKITDYMQKILHEFDRLAAPPLISSASNKSKQYYLLSSIMEESIASSQMEGASTTRKIAKDMLRMQKKPKDKSQQMIYNNYNTIRFLSDHKDEPLSKDLILEIHKQITENTLERTADEGCFRSTDDIVISDSVSGDIAHFPPTYSEIELIIDELCDFANSEKEFIHPIVKAIMIHFMISFLHPFVDGNGRTARSLFYWYMMKKGYWLIEYLSISRVIYVSKNQYEKAFLYTEYDNYDLGYFINYHLNVLYKAVEGLKSYLEKQKKEMEQLAEFRGIGGINERQVQIIKMAVENPARIFISKELQRDLGVSVKTIRSDLEHLVELGLLKHRPMNKRLIGYMKSDDFESSVETLKLVSY